MNTEDIVTLFQALLGRMPNDQALRNNAPLDLDQVLRRLVNSAEFADRMTGRLQARMTEGLASLDAPRLVYLHIPKCGGTTLHNLLAGWWGAAAIHRERLNGLYYHSAASLAAKQVFSGHFDFYSTRLVPGRPWLISFLRDPKARLVSLYNFHRAHRPVAAGDGAGNMVRWAQEMDIDAYFADERIRSLPAIDNSVARYYSDVPQVPHRWGDGTGPRVEPVEVMAAQALANLERFHFIGFMEDFQQSVEQLARLLGRELPPRIERHQVLDEVMENNPGMRKIDKQRPSERTLAEMDALVRFDTRIHAAARARFAAGTAGEAAQ